MSDPVRRPRLIPVVDLMAGAVVRAVGGRRETYRPLPTAAAGPDGVVTVACRLLGAAGTSELYVADLDAIGGSPSLSPALPRLLEELAGPVWLDVGIGPRRSAGALLRDLPAGAAVRPVVGLETAEPGQLRETLEEWGVDRVAVSLDLQGGRLVGNAKAWGAAGPEDAVGVARTAVRLGATTLIVLDVARVGTRTGCGTEPLLRALRQTFPALQLFAGGGIRSWSDVDRLGEAGADAVLVATALHDGTLGADPGSSRGRTFPERC